MPDVVLTYEIIAVLGILAFAVILFIFEVVRVDVAALVVLVILGLSSLIPDYGGLIPSYQLFQGFSSNAVMSIIAVMIIGAGLDLSLIHISEPTRPERISYAVFCLKKKK